MTVPDREYSRGELIEIGGEPVLVNIGCGTDERGIGIDIHYDTAEIQFDLNKGIPIADDSVDQIIAEHILEHLENPSQILREIRRVLRADGEAVIEVPNAGWLPIRIYITIDIQKFWNHKIPDENGHWLARHLGNTDPNRTPHLTLWTKGLLANYLKRTGFEYEFVSSHHLSQNIRVRAWLPKEE